MTPTTPARRAAEKLATCGLLNGVTVVLHGSEDKQKLNMVAAIITDSYAPIIQQAREAMQRTLTDELGDNWRPALRAALEQLKDL